MPCLSSWFGTAYNTFIHSSNSKEYTSVLPLTASELARCFGESTFLSWCPEIIIQVTKKLRCSLTPTKGSIQSFQFVSIQAKENNIVLASNMHEVPTLVLRRHSSAFFLAATSLLSRTSHVTHHLHNSTESHIIALVFIFSTMWGEVFGSFAKTLDFFQNSTLSPSPQVHTVLGCCS